MRPQSGMGDTPYRLWVNADSTILVTLWKSGALEVAFRADPDEIWSPPIVLTEDTKDTLE